MQMRKMKYIIRGLVVPFLFSVLHAQNGGPLSPHNSINKVEFASQYAKNKVLWDKAFQFLQRHDLSTLPVGDYRIEEGRCWATISEYIPKTTSTANLESHKRFIDLQYTLRGNEKMGLACGRVEVRMPYDTVRDVTFYIPQKMKYYATSPATFFMFFPTDKHQPSVRHGHPVESRKVVIKIEYVE